MIYYYFKKFKPNYIFNTLCSWHVSSRFRYGKNKKVKEILASRFRNEELWCYYISHAKNVSQIMQKFNIKNAKQIAHHLQIISAFQLWVSKESRRKKWYGFYVGNLIYVIVYTRSEFIPDQILLMQWALWA